ncbi:S-layer protein [Candidatus Micrarchaeota archaeon]|nr:S-layer protein [Candidatus Micrarchaeota archaeon]
MKGLNVKRIAALAAGAAILGATLAYAGAVTYSNTPIISAEGAPQVKVVVGANAAASDGVAAANIAALIGNLAFKSQAITATVGGTANLGCTVSGAGGAGTCAVSNQKVTLDVTVPGTIGGVNTFNLYINDWIDKKLENRLITGADDIYSSTVDRSPYYYAQSSVSSGLWASFRKVSATDYAALSSPSVTDPYANKQYTEEQTLWFQGQGAYDGSNKKALVAQKVKGSYQVDFTQDDAGIPAGTCDATSALNLATSYQNNSDNAANYAYCPDTDQTARHRVHVGFLGDTYILSSMSPPSDTVCAADNIASAGNLLTTTTSECFGGSINLAKESAYGIVHVGENLTAGAYTLKLVDIEAPLGAGAQSEASIAIYDSTGALLKEDKIDPNAGSSYTWTAPDGSKIRIKVYKTNPGYYAYAKWAEMAVYSQEFTMNDGQQLNSDNTNWYVRLVWRNKDPTYTSKSADSLRKIILFDNHFPSPSEELGSGDTYNVITTPVAFQLQFGGITLGTSDYDTLSMQISQQSGFTVQTNYDSQCTGTGSAIGYLSGNFMMVQSNVKSAFLLGADQFPAQSFYIYLGNGSSKSSNASVAEDGDIIFQKPSGSCYYKLDYLQSMYYMAGDASSYDWVMTYANATYSTNYTDAVVSGVGSQPQQSLFSFTEAASSTAGVTDTWGVPIYSDNDYKAKFLLSTSATRQVRYAGVSGVGAEMPPIGSTTAEIGYYSERGTQLAGMDTQSVVFNRARKLGELKFFVKSQGANTTTATTVGPLAVNDSANVGGGVTIKVDSITSTVGTCTAGPNAQCTVTGQSGLMATPSVTAANVRTALDPASAPLVVLDSQADISATLIVVGGPAVNTVAASTMQGSSLTLVKAGDYIAQPVGNNRILVAGFNGVDTTTAANKFIADLITAAQ